MFIKCGANSRNLVMSQKLKTKHTVTGQNFGRQKWDIDLVDLSNPHRSSAANKTLVFLLGSGVENWHHFETLQQPPLSLKATSFSNK